jgi:hypothetical protein
VPQEALTALGSEQLACVPPFAPLQLQRDSVFESVVSRNVPAVQEFSTAAQTPFAATAVTRDTLILIDCDTLALPSETVKVGAYDPHWLELGVHTNIFVPALNEAPEGRLVMVYERVSKSWSVAETLNRSVCPWVTDCEEMDPISGEWFGRAEGADVVKVRSIELAILLRASLDFT